MAGQFGFMRNAIRNLMPMLREAFKSGAQALGFIRDEGLKIRTATFYEDWGETVTAEAARASLRRVRNDHTPRTASISPSKLQIQRKYQVIGEVSFFHEDRNAYEIRHISFLTDELKTKGELISRLNDIAQLQADPYDAGKVEAMDLKEIKQSVFHGS